MSDNEFFCGDGRVFLDAAHCGRIFADLQGERLHRYDTALEGHFDPVAFNNLGGNSLWPAPEGGAFAYNYLDGDWLVQPGVNVASSVPAQAESPACTRTVSLLNRKGTPLQVVFRRQIFPLSEDETAKKYSLLWTGYREEDKLTFVLPVSAEKAVIAAWSLEQFPGSDGIVAFGHFAGSAFNGINRNFYGNPEPRLHFPTENWFRFQLGGEDRLQIGLNAKESPNFIGAYDPSRYLLILRSCPPGRGIRIDIADNDQPGGIYGASDQFSIFNGGPLKFFELETIAPMECSDSGLVTGSSLTSETRFFRGSRENLKRMMQEIYGMPEGIF